MGYVADVIHCQCGEWFRPWFFLSTPNQRQHKNPLKRSKESALARKPLPFTIADQARNRDLRLLSLQ